MRHSIEWHEKCLEGREGRVKRLEEELQRLEKFVAESRQDAERLRSQIARAKRLGRDEFDSEKFQPEKGGE